MLYYIIKLNGIYDIICSVSILDYNIIPNLRNLHLKMFKYNNDNKLFERFFAYWIFTYGVMRLFGSYAIASYSYYLEALFFFNEYLHNSVHNEKHYL